MGGACGTNVRGKEEERIQGFCGKTKGRGHTEYIGIDGSIILQRMLKKYD